MSARAIIMAGTIAALAACVPVARAPETRANEIEALDYAPIVRTCVGAQGKIESVHVLRSSGHPELDEAALKVARASRYNPGTEAGKALEQSCVDFKVKFVIKDGEPVPQGAPQTSYPGGGAQRR